MSNGSYEINCPKCTYEMKCRALPDITIQGISPMPNVWFRFWCWVFFGAKFKDLTKERELSTNKESGE